MLLPVIHAAEWPPRPQLTQLQKKQLQGVSAALLTRSVVSQARRAASKPPLRLELGQQEEASLVDSKPPGPWQLFTRAIVLLLIFLPTVLTALLARYWRTFRERVWFPLVKTALASAGTAFIKWGQWASTRPDVFPERLCAVLSELHSQAPRHGWAHTRREVETAMGKPVLAAFASFDEEPFASGSIAQMHRATDARGQPLAVKVRHPNVVDRIQTDFALMLMLADFSARVPGLRWLNLKASVSQFSSTMVAQTRLDIEAEHLRRFGWNFGTSGWQDVRFPRVLDGGAPPARRASPGARRTHATRRLLRAVRRTPHAARRTPHAARRTPHAARRTPRPARRAPRATAGPPLAPAPRPLSLPLSRAPRVPGSHAVLLETFEPGELVSTYTIDKIVGGGSGGATLPRHVARFVVTRGEDLYLKMLLVDNLMHADLHPGNILLYAPPHADPTLVLIDAGMVRPMAPHRTAPHRTAPHRTAPRSHARRHPPRGARPMQVARLRPIESKNFIGFLQAVGAGDGAWAARAVLGFSDHQTCEDRDGFATDSAPPTRAARRAAPRASCPRSAACGVGSG